MINFSLMRHWENWVTICLMVAIGFFALNCVEDLITKKGS